MITASNRELREGGFGGRGSKRQRVKGWGRLRKHYHLWCLLLHIYMGIIRKIILTQNRFLN